MKDYVKDLLIVFLLIEVFFIGLALYRVDIKVNELERRLNNESNRLVG